MKKLHVLIPSLVATASMPLIGLVGCGDPEKPTETYVVTLFAGEGTFGETNQIILSNIKPGTILKDVKGYKEPTDESFIGWLNGRAVFSDDQPINSNMLLTAKYNNPEAIHTITLFAGEGVFVDGTNVKKVSVTGDETTLQDAIGSIEPQGETKFHQWITSTGTPAIMTDPVIADIELSAQYEPTIVKYKAYVVTTDDKEISLTQTEVEAGKEFTTVVEYKDGTIAPSNISVYVDGNPIVAVIAQGADSHHVNVTLTSQMTTSDVAIVVNFPTDVFHSYICNKPDDGLELIDNTISEDGKTVGTFSAPTQINNYWTIERVIVNKVEVDVSKFELQIDESNPKKATIKVLNGVPINGDVLIWFNFTGTHLEWQTGDPLFEIPQADADTDPDVALSEFNEFVLDDRLNIAKDYINTAVSPMSDRTEEIECDVYDISYDDINKEYNLNLDTYCISIDSDDTTRQCWYFQARGVKGAVTTLYGSFWFVSCIQKIANLEAIRAFLVTDKSWSIKGFMVPDETRKFVFDLDSEYVAALTDEQWNNQWHGICNCYSVCCLTHPIYYLQNIIPPEN